VCVLLLFYLQYFPKYLSYLNLRVCVICTFVIHGLSHNRYDHFMCMFVLESHLPM
jgi:hypothetical protein